jgi:hypothetical protein
LKIKTDSPLIESASFPSASTHPAISTASAIPTIPDSTVSPLLNNNIPVQVAQSQQAVSSYREKRSRMTSHDYAESPFVYQRPLDDWTNTFNGRVFKPKKVFLKILKNSLICH